MAGKIKGITIEIGGNTQPLNKALADVNKKSKDLQSELRQVERLLKLDPGNTELLAQKHKLLAEAVSNSKEKLDRLKTAQQQVNEQFAKGEISEEQYRAFQREVAKAEQELKGFEKQLSTTVKTTETWKDKLDKAQNSLKDFGGKMTDMGKNLSMKVTAPIVAVGAASFKMAADLEDAMGATDQIFAQASDSVKKWADGLDSYYGIAESEALEYANMMGSMLKNIGGLTEEEASKQAATLIELAGDLTAMYGGTTADAVRALTGALKGNNTMLDNYGMAANDAMVKTKALEMGLYDGTGQMDLASKQAATLALIMEQSGAAQGQAAREAEGASGGMRAFATEVKNLSTDIGQVLLPVITPLIKNLNGIAKKFGDLSPGMKKAIVIVAGLAAAIGPLLIVLGMMASGLGAIVGILPVLGTALTVLTGPVGIVIAIIAALTVAWIKWGDDVKRIVRQTVDKVKNFFGDMVKAGKDLIKGLWEGIKNMGTWLKNLVVGFVDSKLIGPIKKLLKISSPSKLMEEIGKFITLGLANGIESGGDVLNEKAKKVVTQATETMMKAVDEYNNQVEKALENMALEEEKLTQEYEGQLDRRKSALYNWIGIFDEVPEKMKVTGKELLENLKGQVNHFSAWQNEIAELSKKAVDEGLINELRQMGPKALPQIEALNNMSGRELEKYVSLWREKHELAKEEATDELEGLKAETNKKIDELHKKTNEQLELYAIDFVKKMNGIRVKTGDELKAMSVEAQTHGASMITNLVNGILDKLPELNSAMARVRNAMDVGEGGMGISMGFTGIPAMATGTNYIPRDMLAYLHKGEAVVPAKYNPQNTPTTVIKEIHIHGNNADEIWSKFERNLHKLGVVF